MPKRWKYYAWTSVLLSGLLLLANFLGARIWCIKLPHMTIIQDGGVLVFPLIYVLGDILAEIYGEKLANKAALMAMIITCIAAVFCLVVDYLPALPGADNVEITKALGLSVRVMLASAFSFLMSSYVNNWLYEILRKHTLAEQFCRRALGSSVGAHLIDAAVFNALAFAGRSSVRDLIVQMLSAFVVSFTLEALLNPISKVVVFHLRENLGDE